jgi:hypothetical protein
LPGLSLVAGLGGALVEPEGVKEQASSCRCRNLVHSVDLRPRISGRGPRRSSSWRSGSSTSSSVSSSAGSRCWPAGVQERRDPRATARGRGLEPTGRPATTLLAGPGRALGADAAAIQTASMPSIRDPGDAAALASGAGQTPLTQPHSPPGRPSTAPKLRRLILSMALRTRRGANDASRANSPGSGTRSRRVACGCSSNGPASSRHRAARG